MSPSTSKLHDFGAKQFESIDAKPTKLPGTPSTAAGRGRPTKAAALSPIFSTNDVAAAAIPIFPPQQPPVKVDAPRKMNPPKVGMGKSLKGDKIPMDAGGSSSVPLLATGVKVRSSKSRTKT